LVANIRGCSGRQLQAIWMWCGALISHRKTGGSKT
jgi:hypothetical protein